jgi:hypothetical protein
MGQHTADSTLENLKLMVTTETKILRNEFDNKIQAIKAEHDGQFRSTTKKLQQYVGNQLHSEQNTIAKSGH